MTLRPIGLTRWPRHLRYPFFVSDQQKNAAGTLSSGITIHTELLPTLVLPRSGTSGRRPCSRPLSPLARAPVFILISMNMHFTSMHFTPALRSLSTSSSAGPQECQTLSAQARPCWLCRWRPATSLASRVALR